jgi:hypothetical protein
MQDFININTTAFNEAVANTPTITTMLGDVTSLCRQVRDLTTERALDNCQFDGVEAQFDARVIGAFERSDLHILSEADVEEQIDNYDFSDKFSDAINDAVNEIVDDDYVRNALGLDRNEEIITDDNFSEKFEASVDMTDYVCKDEFDERLHAQFGAVQQLLTVLTEEVLRTQNLMGMPTNQRLLDAVMNVANTLKEVQ